MGISNKRSRLEKQSMNRPRDIFLIMTAEINHKLEAQ